MNTRYKSVLKTVLASAIIIGGLYSTQKVNAEWTPDEQHLTGLEANNIDCKKMKVATESDYEKLQQMAAEPGAHYLNEAVIAYTFPENNDSLKDPEIYKYSPDDTGKFTKGEKDDWYNLDDYLTNDVHRIIGTINIDGQGYFIEHSLHTIDQTLIASKYFNLPYAGYKLKKHAKFIFYDKNGKRVKRLFSRGNSANLMLGNYVVSKDPLVINGQKFRRLYAYSVYGTTEFLNVLYVKNIDFKKKFKPGAASLGDAGQWVKAKGKKSYTHYKPTEKYYKDEANNVGDTVYPDNEDQELVASINAQYLNQDYTFTDEN